MTRVMVNYYPMTDINWFYSAGLSIPAPPNEVPQTNTTQPSMTTSNLKARVLAKPKKSKLLEPSKTLITARYVLVFSLLILYLLLFRNLYAIFYKKAHPDVTEAEFREIYKGLDKETVKVLGLGRYFPQQCDTYWFVLHRIMKHKASN